MTQLETLKLDVAALAEKINSAMASSEDSVRLTQQQLKEFAQTIQDATVRKVINRFELEVNVDRSEVLYEIVNSMDGCDDVTDEDIVRYLDTLKK